MSHASGKIGGNNSRFATEECSHDIGLDSHASPARYVDYLRDISGLLVHCRPDFRGLEQYLGSIDEVLSKSA